MIGPTIKMPCLNEKTSKLLHGESAYLIAKKIHLRKKAAKFGAYRVT